MYIANNKALNFILKPLIWATKYLGSHNPELLVKIRYYVRFHKRLNLDNPETLNEKILYQSLRTEIGLRTKLTDKWRVREYVEECGLSNHLVKLYGVWDNASKINFNELPEQFVLKPNHGCGDVIIVKDKKQINRELIISRLNENLNRRYGELEGGRHYYDIVPVVVAEELLINDNVSAQYSSSIIDYKIWCFNGKASYVMTCSNRKDETTELMIYDTTWKRCPEYMNFNKYHLEGKYLPKPKSFERMLEIAEVLAKPFSVVRVDLYNLDGRIYFGEMTFTSLGGLMEYYVDEFQEMAGSLIDLTNVKEK